MSSGGDPQQPKKYDLKGRPVPPARPRIMPVSSPSVVSPVAPPARPAVVPSARPQPPPPRPAPPPVPQLQQPAVSPLPLPPPPPPLPVEVDEYGSPVSAPRSSHNDGSLRHSRTHSHLHGAGSPGQQQRHHHHHSHHDSSSHDDVSSSSSNQASPPSSSVLRRRHSSACPDPALPDSTQQPAADVAVQAWTPEVKATKKFLAEANSAGLCSSRTSSVDFGLEDPGAYFDPSQVPHEVLNPLEIREVVPTVAETTATAKQQEGEATTTLTASAGSPSLSGGSSGRRSQLFLQQSVVAGKDTTPEDGSISPESVSGKSATPKRRSLTMIALDIPELTSINEAKTAEELADLVALNEDEEAVAIKLRANVAGMKKLNVAVCGTETSGKALWLAQYVGYVCARRASSDCLRRRELLESQLYLLEFALADGSFCSSEVVYRWGEAFVIIWDVQSRESFEAAKALHQAIIREKDTTAVPMLLVACHRGEPELTWKVTHEEGAAIGEALNIPFVECCDPRTVRSGVRALLEEERKMSSGEIQKVLSQRQLLQQLQPRTLRVSEGRLIGDLDLVTLGDRCTGKTSFISRAFDKGFSASYTATTAKSSRKETMRFKTESFMVKLVDSPGSFCEQAMFQSKGVDVSIYESAAELAVSWLRQQSLLQVNGFVVVFSHTSRESFLFAQELVRSLQLAMLNAPAARNQQQVILLLGTKTDLTNLRAVTEKELADAAKRLGENVIPSSISLKTAQSEVMKALLQRLVNIVFQREKLAAVASGELERRGWLSKGKDRKSCKSKRFFALRDCVLYYGHSEKDCERRQLAVTEDAFVEAVPSDPKAREPAGHAFRFKCREKELWLLAPTEADRDAWISSLRASIAATKSAMDLSASGVPVRKSSFQLDPKVAKKLAKEQDKAQRKLNASSSGSERGETKNQVRKSLLTIFDHKP